VSSSDKSQTDRGDDSRLDDESTDNAARIGDEPTAEVVDDDHPDVSRSGDRPPHEGDPWERTQDIDPEELESKFQQGAEFPSLLIIAGERAGETRRLDDDHTTLGRKREAVDVWFRDPSVSRTHAEIIRRDDNEVVIRDLESSNGTFVNGRQIDRPTHLTEGDKVTLGSSALLKFTWQDEIDEKFQRRMYNSSIRDELTGAYSRSYLLEQMRSEMAYAVRHDVDLNLVFLDIDRFKHVNDTYGHLAGDRVLVDLAEMIRSEIRQEDLFARYGGEEFAILVRNIPLADVEEMADRIRSRVEHDVFEEDGSRFSVTISAGVAPFVPDEMEAADDWIRAADQAMYLAKEAGRNCVRIHGPALDLGGDVYETMQ